jgi:antitoxin component YwqK of YwqJK toxin-antitoxin module
MNSKVAVFLIVFIPLIGFSQVFHRKTNQWDNKFKRQGLWITWQNEEKHIPSSKSWYKHGVEYRVTRYYHENGKTRLKFRFIGDSIVKVKYFDSKGHLTDKGRALRLTSDTEYRFCWDGEWKHFDEHHKLVKTSIYRKGEELVNE